MVERPLLVSGPLIGPILRGEKRVTRRLIRDVEAIPFPGLTWDTVRIRSTWISDGIPCATWATADGGGGGAISRRAAPCAVGDVLWVRETWGHTGDGVWSPQDALHAMNGRFIYRATDPAPCAGCWFPSIHMPRKAARIFLRVEDVRVERVQDITEEDARAEGIDFNPNADFYGNGFVSARAAFADLWDSLAPDGSKWADNLWVWRIAFKLEDRHAS